MLIAMQTFLERSLRIRHLFGMISSKSTWIAQNRQQKDGTAKNFSSPATAC
jgi:hypothetical protein